MITMNRERFEGKEFAIQIMSKGAFADNGASDRKTYIVEATTLRLNWVALNEWHKTRTYNCRDCYEDGPAGDAEWEIVKAECAANRKVFDNKIKSVLGIDVDKGAVIEQVHSEVFTVVHIYQA